MTEREAWLELASNFERYHEVGREPRTRSGVCWAIQQLHVEGHITRPAMSDMLTHLREAFPSQPKMEFWYPVDQTHALIRAAHCRVMARRAGWHVSEN